MLKKDWRELFEDLGNNLRCLCPLYWTIEVIPKIRMKQTKGYDYVHLKLEDLEENLRIEYRNYVRKDNKLLLGWIARFLNHNYGDSRKFWKGFSQNSRKEVFTSISWLLSLYIFIISVLWQPHNPCKIWCIAIKTCLKRIETYYKRFGSFTTPISV